jgi:hypothetical protein
MLCTALELYTRIPKNERDAEEDVVRCLAEVKEETKQGRCKLKDYFLIAQRKQKVATLIYAQFYPSFKFCSLVRWQRRREYRNLGCPHPFTGSRRIYPHK